MVKQAIIVAAGQGRRLWPYTRNVPKCLLRVGGKSLLEHQVEALLSQEVKQIMVVAGYQADKIYTVLGDRVRYITNRDFRETSSMYSLWLARESARDGFVVINGDVLFHVGILRALLLSPHPDALAVDFQATLGEEEMKVRVRGERVCALSKTLLDAHGENVGMIKFSAEGSRILFATIEELLRQGLRQVMIPYAVSAIASTYPLAAVPVNGLPWIEMDFPEDYQRAREHIYPAIVQDLRSPAPSLSTCSSEPEPSMKCGQEGER
ncbi:MAG: NTP transferase domain-containing protein [Syntrophobacteria bacterium]